MSIFNLQLTKQVSSIYKLLSIILATWIVAACSTQDIKQIEHSDETKQINTTKTIDGFKTKYQLAVTELRENKYTEAEKLFSELVTEQPNIDGPYCNLAIIYYKAKDYDNSLKLVNHALEINDNNAQAYNLRAQIKLKQGKVTDAKIDYTKAVQINPDYINAQYNLALLYDIYFQDLKNAIQHYEIYLSLLDKPDERTKEWVNHLKGSLNNG